MDRLTVTRAACAVLCSLTLALAACSGSSSGGDGSDGGGHSHADTTTHEKTKTSQHHGTVQTCTLITQAEATKALGESATVGKHDPDSDSRTDCTWSAADIEHFSTFVNIEVDLNFDADYKARNEPSSRALIVITEVPGLGDKAFTEHIKGAPASKVGLASCLRVKKGDAAIIIQVFKPAMTRAQSFAADEDLARAAVGRM